MPFAPFAPFLSGWSLTPDGPAIHTHSSDLLPVRWQGRPAMLKLARSAEEQTGHHLMVWLAGEGTARVYAHDGPALLMERLSPEPSLARLAQTGHDDEATRLLCGVAARLHAPRPAPPPGLPTLRRWFHSLERAAPQGGLLARCWVTARALLQKPQDERPLHGDIHHGNVLAAGENGWKAIDPKGLFGERTYDYANILCNPTTDVALTPGRLTRQSRLVADLAGLDHARLLRWVAAYAGLSAAWSLEDQQAENATLTLRLAELALAEVALAEVDAD